MKIIKIIPKTFGSNSYIVTADDKNCIVIDCAHSEVFTSVKNRNLIPKMVFLTHCHYDHVGGVLSFQQNGTPIAMSLEESKNVGKVADLFLISGRKRVEYNVTKTLQDEEEIELDGLKVKVLLTPGHTSGSVCYLVTDMKSKETALFTGDTLFENSCGRTDFPTGDGNIMQESLKKLASFQENYPLYTGHGEDTFLSTEKENNPFMRDE